MSLKLYYDKVTLYETINIAMYDMTNSVSAVQNPMDHN